MRGYYEQLYAQQTGKPRRNGKIFRNIELRKTESGRNRKAI